MKKSILLFLITSIFSLYGQDYYEDRPVARIDVNLETQDPDYEVDKKSILAKLKTKVGNPFSQTMFDEDLKMLSKDYYRILHDEKVHEESVYISLRLWPNPVIRNIEWVGNEKVRSAKLQSELEISSGQTFNRKDFNEHFNKVKEFYIKKGFFESQLIYVVNPVKGKNQVDIQIDVIEGKSGNIQKIEFQGFSDKERNAIIHMMATKKYNILSSWLTGNGYYEEEKIQYDKMTILNFLHNEGYADARVDIEAVDDPISGQIRLVITADRGQIYEFGKITFTGNSLLSDEEIQKALTVKEGDPFSPENLHNVIQNIKDQYGKEGYIDAHIDYDTELLLDKPRYNVSLRIDEGDKFKIGMIHIIGNETTKPNVILRESVIVPGETFDSRKLKATQMRLENLGYFKSVNVYAVRTTDDDIFGPGYRDVYIEVEEGSTGSANLSIGANSTDNVFGTLELSEKNFNIGGFNKIGRRGLGALRGGGQFFSAKAQLGAKQQNYVLSLMNPYFKDSFWRVGGNLSYQTERIHSDDYKLITYGAEFFAAYPISQYITYGNRYRIKHVGMDGEGKLDNVKDPDQKGLEITTTLENEGKNIGLLSAWGMWLGYDSTDRLYKPHRGLRSQIQADIAGVGGDFYFFKANFTNSLYIPVTLKSTFKIRGDIGAILPFEEVTNIDNADIIQNGQENINQAEVENKVTYGKVPMAERFYLGGVDTVRGYKPMIIGPTFPNRDAPAGGLSYCLLSAEYLYRLLPVVDVFTFFDAGTVSAHTLRYRRLKMSYGWGLRLEIMGQAPVTLGWGYPINPELESDVQNFFFSFGTTF